VFGDELSDSATTFFALLRKSPMVLIRSRTRSSPSAAIFSGVSASANNAGVALLTPASVACADNTTATSSVKGLMCCNSVLGSGLAALKRRNASSIWALVMCGTFATLTLVAFFRALFVDFFAMIWV
jgi:hypothetical protein